MEFFQLTRSEIPKEAASRLHDPEFHRTLNDLERRYDARTDQRELLSITRRTGRALARVNLAEVGLHESNLNLERFNERGDLIDVIVNDDGGRRITIARLADLPPSSPLEELFRPLLAADSRQTEVAAAVAKHMASSFLSNTSKPQQAIPSWLPKPVTTNRNSYAKIRVGACPTRASLDGKSTNWNSMP